MKGENGDSRGDKELMAFADKSRYIGNFLRRNDKTVTSYK